VDTSTPSPDCGSIDFNGKGLALRLIQLFGPYNSQAVVFMDQRYDHRVVGNTETLNEGIANGITDYIKSLVDPAFVTNIVIMGHSRGGCLTLTVARKLRQDTRFAQVRLIVMPFDPICDTQRPDTENWVSDGPNNNTNPLHFNFSSPACLL